MVWIPLHVSPFGLLLINWRPFKFYQSNIFMLLWHVVVTLPSSRHMAVFNSYLIEINNAPMLFKHTNHHWHQSNDYRRAIIKHYISTFSTYTPSIQLWLGFYRFDFIIKSHFISRWIGCCIVCKATFLTSNENELFLNDVHKYGCGPQIQHKWRLLRKGPQGIYIYEYPRKQKIKWKCYKSR